MDRQTAYTSPRRDVAALVPPEARRILELGCSTGATAAWLKADREVEMVGVEYDRAYESSARAVLDGLVMADLNDLSWLDRIDGSFDCIVAADVLEHLLDPWAVLRAAASRLRPGGAAVLSLPHVGHLQTVIGLLRGRWPYRDRGVHDATHLRHFTLREIHGLCAAAGMTVERVERTFRFLDRSSRLDQVAAAARFTPLRGLFTYQYVVRARLDPSTPPPAPETVPPWIAPA